MNREEMIKAIYEKVAEDRNVGNEVEGDFYINHIYIGDIFDYIEKNNNWWIKGNNPAITQYNGDMEEMFENCLSLYEEKRKPIEEQSEILIKYIFDLVNK